MEGSTARPSMDASMAVLFASEAFLRRVFVHLIEDGLHECRLVCRLWNDTVKKMPVRLKLSNGKHTPFLVKTFPNAVAFKTPDIVFFNYRNYIPVDAVFFRHCALLKQLRHLEILVRGSFYLGDGFESCFQNMLQLQSLIIRLELQEGEAYRFYEGIRQLTQLTRLAVNHWSNPSFQAPPLRELKKIQSLDCSSYRPTTHSGALICPSLTALTHLSLSLFKDLIEQSGDNSFLKVRPFNTVDIQWRSVAGLHAVCQHACISERSRTWDKSVAHAGHVSTEELCSSDGLGNRVPSGGRYKSLCGSNGFDAA